MLPAVDAAIVVLVVTLIVAYLRRAMLGRFLLSLAVVLCFHRLAEMAGLPMLRSFAGGVLTALPVLMVVIFQHDIRRWLSAGSVSLRQQSHPRSDFVSEVGNAVVQLARQRIGALIVIQQEGSLDHLVEIGTEIDAKVTAELISSIFLPYSPIHDGAVVIHRGKIICAGCFLPLSQDPTLAKSLGTRHRAALGLSEETDAVVVIVSEESGFVSLAHGGSLTLKLAPEETEEELRKVLGPRGRGRN